MGWIWSIDLLDQDRPWAKQQNCQHNVNNTNNNYILEKESSYNHFILLEIAGKSSLKKMISQPTWITVLNRQNGHDWSICFNDRCIQSGLSWRSTNTSLTVIVTSTSTSASLHKKTTTKYKQIEQGLCTTNWLMIQQQKTGKQTKIKTNSSKLH